MDTECPTAEQRPMKTLKIEIEAHISETATGQAEEAKARVLVKSLRENAADLTIARARFEVGARAGSHSPARIVDLTNEPKP